MADDGSDKEVKKAYKGMLKNTKKLGKSLGLTKQQKKKKKKKKSKGDRLDTGEGRLISAGLVLTALAVTILIIPGITVVGFFTGNTQLALGIIALYLLLIYVTSQSNAALSYPFFLITFGILLVLLDVLPQPVREFLPLEGLAYFLGFDITALNGMVWLSGALLGSAIYWTIQSRISGSAKKPTTIADDVFKKFGKLVDIYSRITVLFGLFVLFIFYILMANSTDLIGQIGDLLAIEPFLTSNIFATITGYAALGGELPYIGSLPFLQNLSPIGWVFVTVGAILLAGMAMYEARGRTARLF